VCIAVSGLIKGCIWKQTRIHESDSFTFMVDGMTTLQAICLGAMLAWTPALIVMAWALYEAPLDELDEFERDPS
jgi:hypothetical protein